MNEKRLILFHPEKQKQRSIFYSVIPTDNIVESKRGNTKHNRNGTMVIEVTVKIY